MGGTEGRSALRLVSRSTCILLIGPGVSNRLTLLAWSFLRKYGSKGAGFSGKIADFDYSPTPKGIGLPDIAAIRFSAAIIAI